jgi:hypothetical protein
MLILSERMLVLQDTMEKYGEITIKNYRFIHAFGDAIIEQA